jgi:hypothetical protein
MSDEIKPDQTEEIKQTQTEEIKATQIEETPVVKIVLPRDFSGEKIPRYTPIKSIRALKVMEVKEHPTDDWKFLLQVDMGIADIEVSAETLLDKAPRSQFYVVIADDNSLSFVETKAFESNHVYQKL